MGLEFDGRVELVSLHRSEEEEEEEGKKSAIDREDDAGRFLKGREGNGLEL